MTCLCTSDGAQRLERPVLWAIAGVSLLGAVLVGLLAAAGRPATPLPPEDAPDQAPTVALAAPTSDRRIS